MANLTRENRLKKIVNTVFDVDVMEKTRKREVVEARMVYCRILMDEGYKTLSRTAKSLDKHHATVIHYNNSFKYVIKADDRLYELYERCVKMFTEPQRIQNKDLTLVECKNLIFTLENKIKNLTLNLSSLNLEHEIFIKRQKVYHDIYKTIHERVNKKNIKQVTRKLNTYLNGIHS